MQYPVGCEFNPDTVRNEMTSFAEVALSPMAIDKFFHTVISSWIVGAVFVCAVSCWYLLRGREQQLARQSIKIASIVGIVASLLAIHTGHSSAVKVAEVQPMKLAAMEGLYDGGNGVGLTMVAAINPFSQPDYAKGGEAPLRIAMPGGLSLLATGTLDGYVPGINDILNGYTRPDGKRELSAEEKMQRGRKAITALAEYRCRCRRQASAPTCPSVAEGHALLRIWLHKGPCRTGALHPRQLLCFPRHGWCGHVAAAVLPRHWSCGMASGHHQAWTQHMDGCLADASACIYSK